MRLILSPDFTRPHGIYSFGSSVPKATLLLNKYLPRAAITRLEAFFAHEFQSQLSISGRYKIPSLQRKDQMKEFASWACELDLPIGYVEWKYVEDLGEKEEFEAAERVVHLAHMIRARVRAKFMMENRKREKKNGNQV